MDPNAGSNTDFLELADMDSDPDFFESEIVERLLAVAKASSDDFLERVERVERTRAIEEDVKDGTDAGCAHGRRCVGGRR